MYRAFLSTVLPALPQTVDAFGQSTPPMTGYVFVARNGSSITQQPVGTINQLLTLSHDYSLQGWDCYFALAAYKQGCTDRKSVNAERVQAFWQDIDAGKEEGCKYADEVEATKALVAFIKQTGLIPTYIVQSGRGLHVYWCLEQPLRAEQWKRVAHRFKTVCQAAGLDIDTHRSEDLSSILRIPGTKHQKSGNTVAIAKQAKVWSIQAFVETLAKCPHTQEAKPATTAPRIPDTVTVNGVAIPTAYMGFDVVQRSVRPLVQHCPQFRRAFTQGSYGAWMAAINLCKHCQDGERAAHKLSAAAYAGYSEEETQRVYDSINANPALCTTLAVDKPELCAGCPLRGQNASPIRLASRPPEAEVTVPKEEKPLSIHEQLTAIFNPIPLAIEHPSFWIDDRGTMTVVKTQGGAELPILMFEEKIYYLYTTLGYTAIAEQNGAEVRTPERIYHYQIVYADGKTAVMPLTAQMLTHADTLNTVLRNYMIVPSQNVKGATIMAFFNAYINQIKKKNLLKEVPKYSQLGWNEFTVPETGDTVQGFVLGDKIITAYGLYPCCLTEKAAHIAPAHSGARGSLEKWREGMALFTSLNQPVVKFMIGLSFAAPLMKHMSSMVKNAVFSLYSQSSGKGKSTVLQACASLWGTPDRDTCFFTRLESLPARNARLGVIQNIPACMDELTNLPDSVMTDIAFSLCNGKEKNKLRSSGAEFVKTGNWNTITFVTANTSMKAAVARDSRGTDATMYRVIEYLCDFKDYSSDPETLNKISHAIKLLSENYGMAGPAFLYRLMQTPSRIEQFSERLDAWVSRHGFHQAERFISYPCAAALLCLEYAQEYGLIPFSLDGLEDWICNALVPQNRDDTQQLTEFGEVSLGDFLNENMDALLVVKRPERTLEEKDMNSDSLLDQFIIRRPRTHLIGRFEQENHTLYLSCAGLTAWCKRYGMDIRTVLTRFKSEGAIIGKVRYSLGKAVKQIPTTNTRCFVITGSILNELKVEPEKTQAEQMLDLEKFNF